MTIKTRIACGNYFDIQIESGNTTLDLGFHSKDEAAILLDTFKNVCADLEDYLGIEKTTLTEKENEH